MTRAKKTNKEVVVTEVVKFEDILGASKEAVLQAEAEVKRLKELVSKAEQAEREAAKAYNKFKTIKEQAVYEGSSERFKWHMNPQGASEYYKTAWKEVYTYMTSEYDFTVVLTERTDLKKMKWEVNSYGNQITPAERLYNGSTYTDRDYIKNNYTAEQLEGKFKSEAEARAFVNKVQVMLETDHADHIAADRALFDMARVMPRIKVGSIVEHEFYGRGKVINNISCGRWTVKFEGSKKYKDVMKNKDLEPRPAEEDNLKLITE